VTMPAGIEAALESKMRLIFIARAR